MSEPLYDIAHKMQHIEQIFEDENEETMLEALVTAWDEIELDLNAKVTGIIQLMRNWEVSSEGIKSEEQRLAKRRKIFDNKIERLRNYLLWNMQGLDMRKLSLDIATISLRKGGESVVIDNEFELPQGYFTTETKVKPDKAGLKKLAAESDDPLPGFHIVRSPETLMIK